ncbi:RICIN domain-containing protein [Streptomyces sp. 2131.1]|uniref:RICIN domain-containing protein n=1 Tax=Streptomyces sp. 2131.1 TaxID=1855346 RepID=UPI0015A30478|nr:RICIN domain-containing protein [Streptomyces sp. 2131.1]
MPTGSYYKLLNRRCGKVLGVDSPSTADGAQVVQWNDTGGRGPAVVAGTGVIDGPRRSTGGPNRGGRGGRVAPLWELSRWGRRPLLVALNMNAVGGGGPAHRTDRRKGLGIAVPKGFRPAISTPHSPRERLSARPESESEYAP